MRVGPAIVFAVSLTLSPAGFAQTTVNPGALDALPSKPTPPARRPQPTRPQPSHPASRTPQKPGATSHPPATARATKPEKPTIPATPPAILALPPPVAVPLAHPPPPPTIPLNADAPGTTAPLPNGLRVTFGADNAELNTASVDALRTLARAFKANDTPSINLYAYATGNSDDPSTPRRLSLSRALAARAVLMDEGIPSARIYPRALGPAGGDTDRDRVDIIAGQPAPPAPATTPKPTP